MRRDLVDALRASFGYKTTAIFEHDLHLARERLLLEPMALPTSSR
jgi:hypothetical protein